jgi:SAM-dependent methyltransferase
MGFDTQAGTFEDYAGLEPAVGGDVARAVLEVGRVASNDLLLEVGAGTGTVGRHLAALPCLYVGLDLSRPMLEMFRQKLGDSSGPALLLQADAERPWPVGDQAAAVVYASRVVHLLEAESFVREVLRVVRPGGCLLLGKVTRDSDSVRSRLQRQKRTLLAEHGIQTRAGEQAITHILDACHARGALPLAARTVARWTRTTTVRDVLDGWEAKPLLSNSARAERWDAGLRATLVNALADWARHEFGDLDRRMEYMEQYTLQGVQLPSAEGVRSSEKL